MLMVIGSMQSNCNCNILLSKVFDLMSDYYYIPVCKCPSRSDLNMSDRENCGAVSRPSITLTFLDDFEYFTRKQPESRNMCFEFVT